MSEEHPGLSMFRITLLGMGDAGKTSLVNVFVNNFCPVVYSETNDPQLYYKKVRLDSDEDEAAYSALVEIEDTYSSYRGDGKSYGVPRNPKTFMDMSTRDDMFRFDSKSAKLTPQDKWKKYAFIFKLNVDNLTT